MAMSSSSLPDIFCFLNPSSSVILSPLPKVRILQRPPTDSVQSLSSSLGKLSLRSSGKVVCKSTYNVQVIVGENEPEDRLVNRFRREVLRAGIIQESKRRRFFENTQEKRKRKTRDAARRNRKRRPVAVARAGQMSAAAEEEEKKKKKKEGWYDEAEDNWNLPPNIP